ncbi:MAG: single-stranded DNA-binding protein [Oscillospiraceae bacterium]|jgi:single-strand DNA-binding protein|nr:single-stranded DNA-binding protein [Oscillospiraceae bacterium]
MLNVIILTGRLVEDPELRHTKDGNIPVTSFRMAVRRDFVRKDDADTDFFDVVAWRGTAEFICKYFKKGAMIQLHGRLQNRLWQDKHNQNRVTAEIITESAYFCESRDKDGANGGVPADISPFDDPGDSGSPPSGFDPFA